MSESPELFFPSRHQRDVLGFVLDEFPFPLALTYARLQEELDRQEPVAAAWRLRDAFECLVKFTAAIAVADFLQADPEPAAAESVVGLLLRPQGLTIGHWHMLLELGLAPLERFARDGRLAESGRCLPKLFGLFFEVKSRAVRPSRTKLNDSIDGTAASYTRWRNGVFGHGVFKQERRWYAEETLRWLGPLHRFYEALRPVLEGRRLIGITPGDEELLWQGHEGLPPVPRHEHRPWGQPLPMRLDPVDRASGRRPLSFGPLLSVQLCAICGQPAAFFFDRHQYDREKDRHRTFLLEYYRGHGADERDWQEVRRLAARLPPAFEWRRTSFDSVGVEEGRGAVFREFEDEFLRPDYLADAVWRIVEEQARGYIHLAGPGGTGKTYLVRGLEREGPSRGVSVLAYYILPGALTDYRTFLTELSDRAKEALQFRTQEVQSKVATLTELEDQFAAFLKELMLANRQRTLVVAIDALDELQDPARSDAAITDFLPPPERLPEGRFILLTRRAELRPRVRERIARLQKPAALAGPDTAISNPFTRLELAPDAADNRQLVRAYLQKRLPAALRSREHVEAVLERSGGIFLYAFHLCRALEAGAFPDTASLPEADRFYPAYLDQLRGRTGDDLYETVYLPTLMLLAAAQQPVSVTQLARWGVPADRLQFALLDLRDFLRVHRVPGWHDSLRNDAEESRYELAHEAFARFVREDPILAPRLRQAHATIGRLAFTTCKAESVDPTDDSDLYDLRFALLHLRKAGVESEASALQSDEAYASLCWSTGYAAVESARHRISLDLFDRAVMVYEELTMRGGPSQLAPYLAGSLTSRGIALSDLGQFPEALAAHDAAIAILRPMVETDWTSLSTILARVLANRGNTLCNMGRFREALEAYEAATAILQPLVEGGRAELTNDLAKALRNRGDVLRSFGRVQEALTAYDAGIAILSSLVEAGRAELASELTLVRLNRALLLYDLGKRPGA